MLVVKLSLSAVVAVVMLAGGAAVAETAAEIPKNSYYDDPLTASERSGIAQEENVLPSDGQPSVPDAPDDGVIPDATVDQRPGLPSDDTAAKKVPGESEAEVVIQDSKKNDKVTKGDLSNCMKDWGPQTQMTKAEWEASCRTTLEYFPAGD
ncbi:MAG: hypothetical protein WC829_09800 [Hyphomicrobium sp.]|jgi:hypothetical protein